MILLFVVVEVVVVVVVVIEYTANSLDKDYNSY